MPQQSCGFSNQAHFWRRSFSDTSIYIALSKTRSCQNVCSLSPLKKHVPAYNHATGRMWISFSMQFIRDPLLLSWPLLFAVKDQISQLTPAIPEACAGVRPHHQELSMPHGPKDKVVPGPLLPLLISLGKGPDAKCRNCQRDIFGGFSALPKSECKLPSMRKVSWERKYKGAVTD